MEDKGLKLYLYFTFKLPDFSLCVQRKDFCKDNAKVCLPIYRKFLFYLTLFRLFLTCMQFSILPKNCLSHNFEKSRQKFTEKGLKS